MGKQLVGKYKPGQGKPTNSGIQKGQRQTLPQIRKTVHELLMEGGQHPVTELMNLIPQLSPKDAARVWLDLLQYVAPKLSAQTIDDRRSVEEPIDVTPKEATVEELIIAAKGEGEAND